MKVIFLDVDGVLTNRYNDPAQSSLDSFYGLDESKIVLLSQLVQRTNAKLVISSTWRTAFDDQLQPLSTAASNFVKVLDKHGLALYDKTPSLSQGRSAEVYHWLDVHDHIESFVILDDHDFSWGVLAPYWIHVNSDIGLSTQNILDAIRLLSPSTT